jgi:DNA-binding SARP family transcriptional activator
MAFEITVLGEVSAANAGRTVNLGSPQQRALLSLLLLARGSPVLLDSFVDSERNRLEETRLQAPAPP